MTTTDHKWTYRSGGIPVCFNELDKSPHYLHMERIKAGDLILNLDAQSVRENLTRYTPKESYVHAVSEQLQQTVFGQSEACDSVARAITRADTGLNNPDRPMSVLMFLGPTGTGKSEMARAMADYLFDDTHSPQLKFVDCAEFGERHSVMRILGAPPSYIGYDDKLVFDPDFLERRNIIVFDEIEKADPALHKLLLSVLANGRLTIRSGGKHEEQLNFSNSYVVFTSNVGAGAMADATRAPLGFHNVVYQEPNIKGAAMDALSKHFHNMPEFLGRIDEIVAFKPLGSAEYSQIFHKFLGEVNMRLAQQGIVHFIATTNECREALIKKATGKYGARDIRNVIMKELLQPLSDVMAEIEEGSALVADYEDGKIVIYTTHHGEE